MRFLDRLGRRKAKPATPPKQRPVKIPKVIDLQPPRGAIDHGTVLQALGLTITTAWLPEGETMRQVRVAVLP